MSDKQSTKEPIDHYGRQPLSLEEIQRMKVQADKAYHNHDAVMTVRTQDINLMIDLILGFFK